MTAARPVCGICGSGEASRVDFSFTLFPTESTDPAFHRFDNYVCGNCGVVYMYPLPDESALIAYYNSAYRRSSYALDVGGRWIDTPVNFEATIQSFQRFRNFFNTVTRASKKIPDVIPGPGDTIVDYGGYQGAFLSAAAQTWGSRGVVVDYSSAGIDFAKRAFGFGDSFVATDMARDSVPGSPRFATAVHSLEHLKQPREFLVHVRDNVLAQNGFLFVEVPNAAGSPLSNPTHFYMYTERSLSYLLESCGYEILDIGFTGFPREHLLVGNPVENIVCLARPASAQKARSSSPSAVNQREAIRQSYRRLGGRALKMTLSDAMKANWTLISRMLMIGIIDRFPQGIAARLRSALIGLPQIFKRRRSD